MKLANVIIGVGGLVGAWLNVTQPLGGLRQPALTLRAEPASSLVATRFDQAQGSEQ